jgi:hypothetical protein
MHQLSSAGERLAKELAERHGFSPEAIRSMLEAVINGNGTMAQFEHPEFAGPGQWMRGGMTMVSDMFNDRLKSRIDALCSDLANLVASQADVSLDRNFQSQSQGIPSGRAETKIGSSDKADATSPRDTVFAPASLFAESTSNTADQWWPSDLGSPDSAGAQDGTRYAYFSHSRRLAVKVGGRVAVYDTLDHRITGFSQQQSHASTMSFSSQRGLIDVAALPVVSISERR